jgi:two-component system sensor histidine kinase YesM
LVLFLLLTVIPLFLQSFMTFNNFSSTIRKQAIGYTKQIIKQMITNLERALREDMQKFSQMVLYNQDLLNILEKYRDASFASVLPTVSERTRIFQYIASYDYNRTYIRRVLIITNHGFIFSNEDPYNVRTFLRPEHESWVDRVKAANGRWVVIPRHRPDYLTGDSSETNVSIASLILEPSSAQVIGIVKVDFSDDLFTQLSANYQNSEIGSLFVMNRKNELLYQNDEDDPQSTEQFLKANIPNRNSEFEIAVENRKYLTTVGYSAFTNLKIVNFLPVDSLLAETKPLRRSTIRFGLVCLSVAVLLSIASSIRLTQPLVELRKKMLLVRRGELRQSVPVASRDELGQLSHEFNLMTEQINHLINEVYLIRLREKEAQLSALQSQIHPHFIYNTLEAINMMAIQAGNFEISDTVHALGQFFRYTIGKYDSMVTLKEEMDSVKAYMMIQKIRYSSRLHLILDADPETEEIPVPRLVLQPLLENAIKHGFGDMKRNGTIWVTAHRFGDELLLTVRDDGKGLTDEEIRQLQRSLKKDALPEISGRNSGLALWNINQRLVLLYGPEYGIEIDGAPGQGASFTITIPIRQGRTDHEDRHCGG